MVWAAVLVAGSGPASAGYGDPGGPGGSGSSAPAVNVDAAGNPVSGGLAVVPASVTVAVGDVVQWTNTDSVAPHTSTEDNGLWRLSGTYGPPGAMGYGPGETVQRRFAAGTWSYFCEVHPKEMRGRVAVPVTLRVRHGSSRAEAASNRPRVLAIWGVEKLPADQAFDVQKAVNGGPWRTVRSGTDSLRDSFPANAGKVVTFRARVRRTTAPSPSSAAKSGYSPVAKITVD